MIQITKDEAKYLRANGVSERITRLMRQDSKRKHYFCAEEQYILDLLADFKSKQKVVLTYGEV